MSQRLPSLQVMGRGVFADAHYTRCIMSQHLRMSPCMQ
jgi:hypothetical protein